MHRAIDIGPVHRYVSLRAALDYRRRRKTELVVIAAATNDGTGGARRPETLRCSSNGFRGGLRSAVSSSGPPGQE